MSKTDQSMLDTYLVVGRMRGSEFEQIEFNDDRIGGGTFDSMLRFTPEEAGEYVIRARSYAPGQYGAYELSVVPTASLSTARATPRPLTIGNPVPGSLGPDSPVDVQGSGVSYDLWTFEAQAGQPVQVSMGSYSFDTFLAVGRMQNGRFNQVAENDDRGDGTLNSLLRFTPAESGEYTVVARSYAPEQWGDYELVAQTSTIATAPTPVERSATLVHQGQISGEGGPRYVDFEFEAARGRRYNVRAISTEFIPIVDIGTQSDGQLSPVDFFDPAATDRVQNRAEFTADRRGRYVVRVSAPALSSGQFDLIVTEAR
jgi:hypothetical protein